MFKNGSNNFEDMFVKDLCAVLNNQKIKKADGTNNVNDLLFLDEAVKHLRVAEKYLPKFKAIRDFAASQKNKEALDLGNEALDVIYDMQRGIPCLSSIDDSLIFLTDYFPNDLRIPFRLRLTKQEFDDFVKSVNGHAKALSDRKRFSKSKNTTSGLGSEKLLKQAHINKTTAIACIKQAAALLHDIQHKKAADRLAKLLKRIT